MRAAIDRLYRGSEKGAILNSLLVLLLLASSPTWADVNVVKDRLPPEQPLSEDLAAAISENVRLVQEQMSSISDADFNFSVESIKWLDGFIERNRKTTSDPSKLASALGSYLGETINVRFHCSWVMVGDVPAVWCPGDLLLFPISKTEKQYQNGENDSIYAFFQTVLALSRQASSQPSAVPPH